MSTVRSLPCEHEDHIIAHIDHARIDDTDPIAHTAFYLMGCVKCHRAIGFPVENCALITESCRAELATFCSVRGYQLI
jgi:hypothetical protein